MKAPMFEVRGAKLLDLRSAASDDFNLSVHYIIRIWIEGSSLRWVGLDSDWFEVRAGREIESHKWHKRKDPVGNILVTASKDAVRAFLLKYGADDRVLRSRRLGPAVNPAPRCVGHQMS